MQKNPLLCHVINVRGDAYPPPVYITEETVKSVGRKRLGSSGPVDKELEALQGWILKSGEDSTRIRTIVETFVDW